MSAAGDARAYALGSIGRGGRQSASQVLHRAAIVTDRWRIANERQKEIIDRLTKDGNASSEIARLAGELANADAVLNHLAALHFADDEGICAECSKPHPCPSALPFAEED